VIIQIYWYVALFLSTIPGVYVFHCLKKICESIMENEEKLNDLDRNSGDGDTGTTFTRGAKGMCSSN